MLGDLFLINSISLVVMFHELASGFNKWFELIDDCWLNLWSRWKLFAADGPVSSKWIVVEFLWFKAKKEGDNIQVGRTTSAIQLLCFYKYFPWARTLHTLNRRSMPQGNAENRALIDEIRPGQSRVNEMRRGMHVVYCFTLLSGKNDLPHFSRRLVSNGERIM